jgi:hypothetical protein
MEWKVAAIDSLNILRGAWVSVIELCNSLWDFHIHFIDL